MATTATDFIHKFYRLLDGESPAAAKEWSEMLTEDVEFVTPVSSMAGREEIKSQREQFWAVFPGLKHHPLRIYVSPSSPLDIVVINDYVFTKEGYGDGKEVVSYTAAEYRLVESEGGLLIKKFEIFMDPTVLGWK